MEVPADVATVQAVLQFVSRGFNRATYQIEEAEVVKRAVTRERIYTSRAPIGSKGVSLQGKERGSRSSERQNYDYVRLHGVVEEDVDG